MNFTMTQKSIKDFKNCLKTAQSIYELSTRGSKVFVKFADNFMYSVINMTDNFIKFKTSIENLKIKDGESIYLTLDLQTFSTLLDKASSIDPENSVVIEINGSKISIKNQESVYSFQSIGNYDEDDFEDEFSLRERNFKTTFDDATTLKMNSEIIDFINLTSKSIKLINKLSVVSGIIVEDDLLKFSDKELTIISKKMENNTGKGEKYLPQNLFPVFTALHSIIGDFDMKLAEVEGNKYISIQTNDDYEFDMILPIPFVVCIFPTAEEWKMISAEDNLKYQFDVNKEEFLTALKKFEGVFPSSSWGFKTVYLSMDKDSNELKLSYDDMKTEVHSSITVSNVNVTINPDMREGESESEFEERKKDYEFFKCPISTFAVSGYLEKFCKSDTVHFELSPELPTVDIHGTAVILYSETDGLNIALAKLYED